MKTSSRIRATAILGIWAVLATAAGAADRPRGVGVLGDSYSDEYRFYPPDRSTARNWVELLAERGWNFGPYSEASRGAPRHQGFAYNWARSDAETADLIADGQHTGLAEQVRSGEVDLVVLFAGGNDFIHALHSDDPLGVLEGVAARATANVRTAAETILAASPEVRLVVGTVPDIRQLPEFLERLEAGTLPESVLAAYSAALGRFNAQVRALAMVHPRVALVDFDAAVRISALASPKYVRVGGRKLDRRVAGNEPDHVFLADRRHVGTAVQALLARQVVAAANGQFGYDLPQFSDDEILRLAGLDAPADASARLASFESAVPPAAAAAAMAP
jgi:phospholipase/lecithinase/hemolysin